MAEQSSPSQERNRGPRRRGRGGGHQRQSGSQNSSHGISNGPARGGLRDTGGRAGRSGGRQQHHRQQLPAQQKGDDDEDGERAEAATAKPAAESMAEGLDDAEVCFICASKVEHTSVSPCNHRTCHICALRLRALYKNKACAHCRVCVSPLILFFISSNIS